MNKTLLIIKREYLTRIRNKTFILSTLLTPLLFVGMIGVSSYFAQKNGEHLTIAVYDQSHLFDGKLKSGKNISYEKANQAVFDSLKKGYELNQYSGALYIPANLDVKKPEGVEYYSGKQMGLFSEAQVEDDMNDVLERERMIRADIDTAKLNEIKQNPISIKQTVVDEDGHSEAASSGISYGVGYVSGILIYMMMLVYGTMVMRGVMEEKVNRIAEVVVSSVKPMQLMMGKIIGIGAVGLTQFLIWAVLLMIGTSAIGSSMSADSLQNMQQMNLDGGNKAAIISGLHSVTGQVNIPLIAGAFLFYFICGYLFYASLFAAVGSAVNEDPQDAQSMTFPITIPIIFSFIIMTNTITNPTGNMAIWCSMIPFTAPIIMMARIPFGVPGTVPYWQLALSVLSMIGGIVFIMWLCARIYRTGILMYGKKPSWKEMLKWVFVKR